MQRIYTVHVDVSDHDHLKQGVLSLHISRVRVMADSMSDALLLASQVAAHGGMPTGARVVDVSD